jgi:hypothetical protein
VREQGCKRLIEGKRFFSCSKRLSLKIKENQFGDGSKKNLYLAVLLLSSSVVSLTCTLCNSIQHIAGVVNEYNISFSVTATYPLQRSWRRRSGNTIA